MGINLSSLRWPTPPPCSAAVALPGDVVFEILSWLPAKSLCRFRSVSREWRALISDPAFVGAHRTRGEPLLAASSLSELSTLRLIGMDGNVVKVIKTPDDILDFVCASPGNLLMCVIGDSFHHATVINLATGEQFVTSKRGNHMGFGRATPSGDYKMVCFTPQCSSILTLGLGDDGVEAGYWRPMQSPTTKTISYHTNPVAVNGVLYLASLRDTILCFDLESEEWKRGIEGPPYRQGHFTLGELNGALCMIQPVAYPRRTLIWLLTNAHKGTWFKAYSIPLDRGKYHLLIPLRILLDGGKLLFSVTYYSMELPVLKIYDPHHGTCTDAPKMMAADHGGSIGLCSLH